MKFSKSFKLITLLLVVILLCGGYYFWSDIKWLFEVPAPAEESEYPVREGVYQERPKPGEVQILPTADPKWNLYRNFKYGFQIQYPADWKFIKIFKNNVSGDIFVGFSPYGVDSKIVLNIYHDLELNEFIKKFESYDSLKYERITINNREMFVVLNKNINYTNRGYVYIVANGIYNLGGGGDESTVWYIDRMIETLEVF